LKIKVQKQSEGPSESSSQKSLNYKIFQDEDNLISNEDLSQALDVPLHFRNLNEGQEANVDQERN
jgi:hypothetical protein